MRRGIVAGAPVAMGVAVVAIALAACTDLKMAGRRALYDASLATPQTQEAYRRAQTAIEEIDADDERALGEAVALRIVASTNEGKGLELRDRDLLAYVSHVGNLVALQGTRQIFAPRTTPRLKARRFVFAILDSDAVGAYSTPGGYIFVTRGLLARLTTESELAWVLGHEIAHVDYEDGLAALKADLGTRTALGSMGEALKGPRKKDRSEFENQQFFNAVVDRLYDIYDRSGLNRDHELRCDRVGLEYATAAGYDGGGALRALDNLELGGTIGSFMTHGSRKARIRSMAALLEVPGKTGAERYDRMASARVEALVATAADAANGGTP